jgi:phosphatidylglycerophosphate synthase
MIQLGFSDAKREQAGMLATIESRILQWIVARLPDAINSDHLTTLGFLAMFGAGIAYVCSGANSHWLHVVNLCLLLNWLGDSLDGTLARYRNRLRPRYGFYVDHILDTFSMLFFIGGLSLSGYMSSKVAGSLLVTYFMLCINVYLAAYTLGTFKISFWKFSPTELRLMVAVGNLVLLFRPTIQLAGSSYRLFDVGGVVATILMAATLIVSTIQNVKKLYREERLPPLNRQPKTPPATKLCASRLSKCH